MNAENKGILQTLLHRHDELGISQQIGNDKYYLYSIITHSTAILYSSIPRKYLFEGAMLTQP